MFYQWSLPPSFRLFMVLQVSLITIFAAHVDTNESNKTILFLACQYKYKRNQVRFTTFSRFKRFDFIAKKKLQIEAVLKIIVYFHIFNNENV